MSGRLRIHDVVARKMPRFGDIKAFLGGFPNQEIDFLFPTDRLGMDVLRKENVEDSVLFVSGELPLEADLVFPYSIRA